MGNAKAAVFASGTGSNFKAIVESPSLACDIALLVCDQPTAPVIDLARQHGVPVLLVDPRDYPSKAAFETVILQKLADDHVDWIFLAGYMRLIGPVLLNEWEGRIINIHPSLLPAFPGKDGIGDAFRAGVTETGVTIHYVDQGVDTGAIIAQEAVQIFPDDTQDTLKKRIQAVEHRLYPKVIHQLVSRT
ncbi:phosphoribosylglycinamide formyltransferase [Lentibacillus saliphilus]|uniref:phosphoribosylglycinamide formyltransferase n=1 Tax=Lentibacillus saliphilus TaxID=2737028 RepID=UPI001C30B07F|nr:phosphoribosylglycinamide formyltransferase [Lentibacillus saliphilus]